MNGTAIASVHAREPLLVRGSMESGRDAFSPALRAAREADVARQAREAAAQLVSIALVQPVFAQLRESSLARGPFAPGDAERRFGPMLDQELADRVTSGSNFPLIDDLARRLAAHSARAPGAEGSRREA